METKLIDYMGNDNTVCQAARVSTGNHTAGYEESAGLINYLWREGHTSCFEHCSMTFYIKVPFFIARQIQRHRTFCLAGDNIISFARPVDGIHYPYELERLYKNWNDPAQKARLKEMTIRSVDESTGDVAHNRIVDVIYSGKKDVYTLKLSNGNEVHGSKDHLIFTKVGWRTIGQLMDTPQQVMVQDSHYADNPVKQFIPEHESTEWLPIPGWEGKYEVSDAGEVKSLLGTRGGVLEAPLIKKRTINSTGYLCVSLSEGGVSRMWNVHTLVAMAFLGVRPEGYEVCHNDGNRLNSHVDNLRYDTSKGNSEDIVKHGNTKRLHTNYADIVSIEYRGNEDTYDISVEAPHHNFFANGVVVHNSYNEISGRYSELELEFWFPEEDRPLTNKGSGAYPELVQGENQEDLFYGLTGALSIISSRAEEMYLQLLGNGVATEIARAVLPLNTYTEFYMSGNLKNWLDFVSKRTVPNAQIEIVEIANQIADEIKNKFPLVWEAYERNSNA